MRIIIFMAALLWGGAAYAQTSPEVYTPATPAQIMPYDGTSRTITAAMLSRVVDLLCTTDCFVSLSATGQNKPVTTATGIYLPADVIRRFKVSPGTTIRVIQDSSGGDIHVLELAR